jgi:hypothetical protein
MIIKPSTRQNKRFQATFKNGKTVHFGLKGGQTYIDHNDKIKRENYLKRHGVLEKWTDRYKASTLSRYLLWGDYTTLEKNYNYFMKKFNNP